jgi:hypothetical protein
MKPNGEKNDSRAFKDLPEGLSEDKLVKIASASVSHKLQGDQIQSNSAPHFIERPTLETIHDLHSAHTQRDYLKKAHPEISDSQFENLQNTEFKNSGSLGFRIHAWNDSIYLIEWWGTKNLKISRIVSKTEKEVILNDHIYLYDVVA